MSSSTPQPSDKLWISSLCCTIFYLNAALGEGRGAHITFTDVYREIDRGTLFPFLEREVGEEPRLSFLRPGADQQADLFIAAMRSVQGYEGEERKMLLSSTKHSGVCLVIALIAELIQHGQWDIESLRLYDTRG